MKKEKLTVDFVDFWPNLIKTDNYFYHLLSQEFDTLVKFYGLTKMFGEIW